MNHVSKKIATLVILGIYLMPFGVVNAQPTTGVPPVNLTQGTNSPTSPFGAFKLVQCDGPAKLNDVSTHKVKDEHGDWVVEKINGVTWTPDPKFVACDFRGLMIQIQFMVNAAIVIGVLASLIGFSYAGFLYITGKQENLKKAKSIFPKIFFGFILMLTAWFIVFQILKWLTPTGSAYLQ